MYIVPMSGITPLNIISQTEKAPKTDNNDGASFTDVFKQALDNVEQTQKVSEESSIKASLGEIDDLHTVSINAEKAAIALETFVALKNTAVESYKEVISMAI